MTTRSGDLSFGQARDVYSAFYTAGHADGKSEAKVFGELSLDERKVIVRAIEVLGGRKGTAGSSLVSDDRLTPLIKKLGGDNVTTIDDKDLPNALKGSKPILVQGRAEIGMANRFLVHDKFLKALEPDGELYQKLEGFFNNPHASQKTLVNRAVKEWVENLPPGEGKAAAKEALQYLEASINNFSSAHGFTPENLKKVIGDFRENIHKELVLAWGATPLTKADHQAMGIGALDLLPFSINKTTIKQKRAEFESIVDDLRDPKKSKEGLEERLSQLEGELLPMVRYPECAGLYSRVVGEHVNLLRESRDPEVEDRAIELTKIQYIYAMYAAAKGNGEGAYSFARGFVEFGLWTKDERENTLKEGLRLVDLAINAAKKSGDKGLLAKANVLRAVLLEKNYLTLLELRNEFEEPRSVKKAEKYVIDNFVKLGFDGIEGLYILFVRGGSSADPMIDLLKRFLVGPFKVKPTAEHVKWITTAALAGNEKAIKLLTKLVELYPAETKKVPALIPAALLVKDGVHTNANVSEFTRIDALKCYQEAFDHLANELRELKNSGQLNRATLDAILPRLEVLRGKYEALLRQFPDKTLTQSAMQLRKDINTAIEEIKEAEVGVLEEAPVPGIAKHMDLGSPKVAPSRNRFFSAVSKFFNEWVMPKSEILKFREPAGSPEPIDPQLTAADFHKSKDEDLTKTEPSLLTTTIYDIDALEISDSFIDRIGGSLTPIPAPAKKAAPVISAVEVGDEATQGVVNVFGEFWDAADGKVHLKGFLSMAGQDEFDKGNFNQKQIEAAKKTEFMAQIAKLKELGEKEQPIAIRLMADKMGNAKYVNSLTKLIEDDRFEAVQKLLSAQ